MGTRGFSRVRPVHINGLIKRYRHALGKLRYWQKHHADDVGQLAALQHACTVLAAALDAFVPPVDVSTLRPLPFRPPVPLPGAALTRAVLGLLREAATPMPLGRIVAALVVHNGVTLSTDADTQSLSKRTLSCLRDLLRQHVVVEANGDWTLAQQLALT